MSLALALVVLTLQAASLPGQEAPAAASEAAPAVSAPGPKSEAAPAPAATPVPTPTPAGPIVQLQTTRGTITLELDRAKAPITVANFLGYVRKKHYDGTIFHRVIKGFMIQGGGMNISMLPRPTGPPIKNEHSNGLQNLRGTIAMARLDPPDSATAQFFINHKDNVRSLDTVPGYAVFGKVVDGMDVVDAIASAPTETKEPYRDVPVVPITITRARVIFDAEAPPAPAPAKAAPAKGAPAKTAKPQPAPRPRPAP